MKNKTLAISLFILIALVVSARWASRADNAPAADALQATDTTLAVALSLEDMVNQSDVIAIGNVVETRSTWVDRNLVTLATVSVGESLKGTPGETVTVVLPGGVDTNRKIPVAMTYPGAPRLTPGENVFLFLTSDSEVGGYNVAGFAQGKFSIVNDEDGQPMVSRDLRQVSLQGNNGVRRGQSNMTPLNIMKDQVKGYLKH
ncbi:MAG TPA: hypothetical protein VN844_29250 [Pyrinomonadaceae bacterium]|nr:hypothetical protein [Pyrinomonadaceae bacterium]